MRLRQKAYALAAMLFLEYRGRTRRNVLAERIWPSSTTEQALTNLRQTLLHTRQMEDRYGFELFISDATDIELDRNVDLDLRQLSTFAEVADATGFDHLISLYGGELLSGIDSYGDEFDQWLRTERTRIEDQFSLNASQAALRLGGSAGQLVLGRLADTLPYSDIVCRARMTLHLEQGDHRVARMVFDAFRTRLQQDLGLEPDAATVDLLQASSAALAQPAPIPANEPPQRTAFVPRVVLLPPLAEYGHGNLPRHLAPALVEDVTIGLARLRSLAVIAPHTAWQLDPFTALDEVRAHQIDYAVESRLSPSLSGDRINLAIRLIRTAGREIVWAHKYELSLGTAPERYWDFTNLIALALADNIETAELKHERAKRDSLAYSHYLAGRSKLRTFDLPKVRSGRNSLRMAREIDPGQPSIESALARTYVIEWVLRSGTDAALLDKARLHAERAVAIDPNDGTAYRELGRVALFHQDLDESIAHMEQAAAHAPNHADLLADYADTLTHNSMFDEAEAKMAQAIRLNPLPPDDYLWGMGGIHFFRERFDDALAQLQQMQNQEPALRLMAAAAAKAGHLDLAREYRMRALELQPDFDALRWVSRLPQRDQRDLDYYYDALRLAGFR